MQLAKISFILDYARQRGVKPPETMSARERAQYGSDEKKMRFRGGGRKNIKFNLPREIRIRRTCLAYTRAHVSFSFFSLACRGPFPLTSLRIPRNSPVSSHRALLLLLLLLLLLPSLHRLHQPGSPCVRYLHTKGGEEEGGMAWEITVCVCVCGYIGSWESDGLR